jgi:hypothetical protein
MKRSYLGMIAGFVLTLIVLKAFAQEVVPPSTEELTQYLAILAGIGGLKGAALAVAVVQGLMLFFRTPLANFAGKWKLVVVSGLSFIMAFLAIMVTGASWQSALFNGAVLSAFQVFANQAYKQATEKAA